MMKNFHLNTTVVAIFPNVCLWRRSLCSDLVLTLKNRIEPPSYARTAYIVAIWPSFLFDSFGKNWATCEIFLGKWFTAPPGQKFPVRLCCSSRSGGVTGISRFYHSLIKKLRWRSKTCQTHLRPFSIYFACLQISPFEKVILYSIWAIPPNKISKHAQVKHFPDRSAKHALFTRPIPIVLGNF